MYRGRNRQFKVVHRTRQRYAVWHADAPLMDKWREAGCRGTVADCWNYIQATEGQIGWLLHLPAGIG
ncbi:MAG: hypothetical protein R3300_11465 [Candidatus Promineifilaceae bacterium]|nr:hypothetical protein [Candidatus Promineifilaceae bacterium]